MITALTDLWAAYRRVRFMRNLQAEAERLNRVGFRADEWEAAPVAATAVKPRRMGARIGVHFDGEEARTVLAAASARGVSASAWLRFLALDAAQQQNFNTGAPVVQIRRGRATA